MFVVRSIYFNVLIISKFSKCNSTEWLIAKLWPSYWCYGLANVSHRVGGHPGRKCTL